MTTRVRQLSYPNPGSAGLPIMAPTQDEIDLLRHPNVVHWWDAEHGFDGEGWRCRKTGAPLVKERNSWPALQKIAGYRNVPSFYFASGVNQLWDGGLNMFPAGEFSFSVVGRSGPNQNSFMAGAATVGRTDMTYLQNSDTDGGAGSQGLRVNGGPSLGATLTDPTSLKYADGPAWQLIGNRPQELSAPGYNSFIRTMRLDTGVESFIEGDAANGNLPNVHREFHVGGVNPYGSSVQGALVGGDLSRIVIFNVALNFDQALLDLERRVVRARYSIPTP